MARRILPATSPQRLAGYTPAQRETYARVRHARRLMQNAGMSRDQAAREAGTTPGTMERYLGVQAFEKRGGRVRAKPGGRLYSVVKAPTTSGMHRLVANEREADLARAYKNALWRYLNTDGDDSDLIELEDRSIGGYTLLTDTAEIEELIERGELDPFEVGSGETGR